MSKQKQLSKEEERDNELFNKKERHMRCACCNKVINLDEVLQAKPDDKPLDWSDPYNFWCFRCVQASEDDGTIEPQTGSEAFGIEGTREFTVEGDEYGSW